MDDGDGGTPTNDVNNNDTQYFEFDDLDLHTSSDQLERVKAFSDQRRKLKPKRKHVASSNPVKVLQYRQGITVRFPTHEISDDDGGVNNDDHVEEGDIIVNGTADVGGHDDDKEEHEIQNVRRHDGMNVGKVKEREYALTNDAKKGLEGKEDIHAASRALRVTEKDKDTGVGTEKTNPHDGVKDVMLFHIKGARHVQTRLTEPKTSSLNSGDVFILVTAKHVFQWNGKNCSIMEKARGAEISSVIQQWKELGCNATSVNVLDEGHEKPAANARIFWKILGDKKDIKQIDDVLEDKEFEKNILESNKFYVIKCEDVDDENAECWLELMEGYSGIVPSKKWLEPDKAYVLDFGAEVYSWVGHLTGDAPRKKAAQIGLDHFDKGYENNASLVNLFDLNDKEGYQGDVLPRPGWCVYGRMAEKTENVAFRRKFFDWPDPVDLKVKTVAAKVHSQLTKEFSNEAVQQMNPISAKLLIQPIEEPLMILDGCFIGRGRGMKDKETLFTYGITLKELTVWQMSGEELTPESYGVFYSAEAYVLKWKFEVRRTGIRNLKGGKSRQDDAGKDRIIFFFWQGKDCTSSDKGTAALRTIELNTEEGPQQLVPQGKEPPAFFQLFDGKMIVHSGKLSDDTEYSRNRMYWVRNEVEVETCLVEVHMSSDSLRSIGCFIIVNIKEEVVYIWNGVKTSSTIQKRATSSAENLQQKTREIHNKELKLHEVMEGEEEDEFWDLFNDDEDYMSFLEVDKDVEFTPQCFSFDSLHGYFRHAVITSSAYHPDYTCPFPILQSDLYGLSQPGLVMIDAKHKIFLWQGWWPIIDDKTADKSKRGGPSTIAEKHKFDMDRKLAFQSIKAYAEEVGRSFSQSYIVFAGCEPLEFKNIFPYWENYEEVTQCQLELGRKDGEKLKVCEVLTQLERDEYTLSELQHSPLPEGVDPRRIEQYLSITEFEELFKVKKEEFKKVPRWRQIELKKGVGLF